MPDSEYTFVARSILANIAIVKCCQIHRICVLVLSVPLWCYFPCKPQILIHSLKCFQFHEAVPVHVFHFRIYGVLLLPNVRWQERLLANCDIDNGEMAAVCWCAIKKPVTDWHHQVLVTCIHRCCCRLCMQQQELTSTHSGGGGSSMSRSDPHKLDLMAENSSLKVKLAKAEKSFRDSEERLGIAQVGVHLPITTLFLNWTIFTFVAFFISRNRFSASDFAYSYIFLHSVVSVVSLSHFVPLLECSTHLDAIWQVHLWDPMTDCVRWWSLAPWQNMQLEIAAVAWWIWTKSVYGFVKLLWCLLSSLTFLI